jgi:hypothetical protein
MSGFMLIFEARPKANRRRGSVIEGKRAWEKQEKVKVADIPR